MGSASAALQTYERRLAAALHRRQNARHMGVIFDGNRRWARATGEEVEGGHSAGADKIAEFLGWCDELESSSSRCGCCPPTTSLARPTSSCRCLRIIEDLVDDLAATGAGGSTRSARSTCCRPRPQRLKAAAERVRESTGMTVNSRSAMAVGARSPTRSGRCCRSTPRRADARGARRAHRRRAHRRAPLHQGPARPRPGDPDLRRAAPVGIPALAERALGVLLLRGVVAGLPPDRLPARPAGLRRPRAPLRHLTASPRGGSSSRDARGIRTLSAVIGRLACRRYPATSPGRTGLN